MDASYAMSEEQYARLLAQDPYYASLPPEEIERLARSFAARDIAYYERLDDRTHTRKIPDD